MSHFIAALCGLFTCQGQASEENHLQGNEQQTGQGLVEYALILSFIAIMVIVALIFFGTQLTALYSKLGNSLPTT